MRSLNLPPTTIGWIRDGHKWALSASHLVETDEGLQVFVWNGYNHETIQEAGMFEYDVVLFSELTIDPRDRFSNSEKFKNDTLVHYGWDELPY